MEIVKNTISVLALYWFQRFFEIIVNLRLFCFTCRLAFTLHLTRHFRSPMFIFYSHSRPHAQRVSCSLGLWRRNERPTSSWRGRARRRLQAAASLARLLAAEAAAGEEAALTRRNHHWRPSRRSLGGTCAPSRQGARSALQGQGSLDPVS